jgi:biopolymer transport protein ExbD
MRFVRKKRLQEVVELNITSFMDLMVALISFLLISAVFTRMTVVELNLPKANLQAGAQEEIKLALQLVVHQNAIDIRDVNLGTIKLINHADPAHIDWKTVNNTLVEIKSRFPAEQNITLLLESGVSYKTMIEVMDHVRQTDVVNTGTLETVELFPNISIGDAPVLAAGEPTTEGAATSPAGGVHE